MKGGTLCLWDLETGELRRTIEVNAGSLYSVTWSSDGKTLAIASHNGPIQLGSSPSLRPVSEVDSKGLRIAH